MINATKKACNHCHIEKPLSDFYKSCEQKDGHERRCRACSLARPRKYWWNANPEFVPVIPESKKCSSCSNVKPPSEFQKNKCSRDGLTGYCKLCAQEKSRAKWLRSHPPVQKVVVAVGNKWCSGCQSEKAIGEFHSSRATSDGKATRCRECQNKRGRAKYAKNPSVKLAANAEWQKSNKHRQKGYSARYHAKHPDRIKAQREAKKDYHVEYHKRWYAANLEDKRAKNRAWAKNNPAAHAALRARRRASELRAAAPWADKCKIQAIYEQARTMTAQTGIPHEVDHIYPLQGELVSGLHVEDNLRVIPSAANRSKSNKHPIELLPLDASLMIADAQCR